MFSAAIKSGAAGNPTDPKFNYVTMLLHGDGTNGAQNNTFLDSSTNNFTITRNGNTTQGTFTPYGSNWSNYFDGSGDYLSVASNAANALGSGDFTIQLWFYLSGTTGVGSSGEIGLIGCGDTTSSRYTIRCQGSSTRVMSWWLNTPTNNVAGTTAINLNTWYHVALVRSGSGTNNVKLYLNGVLESQGTSTYNSPADNISIGRGYPNLNGEYTNGYISNLQTVVGTALYTSSFTPSTTPLTAVSGTSLLTCQSNRFIDNSSNNFTITKNGDTSVQRFSPFIPTTAYSTSVIGGSGYFDGTGDYLTTPTGQTPLTLGTSDFTVEMWFYGTTQVRGNPSLFTSDPGAGLANTILVQFVSSTGQTVLWVNNTNLTASSTTNYIKLNQWNHIAVCRSGGSTYSLYINGVAVNNVATNSTSLTTNSWYVGYWTVADNAFTGYITDFRILKGTALYTTAFTPPTAPLTAITNTSLLLSYTNAGIQDNAMMNDLETVGNAQISTSVKKYGTGSMYFDGTGDYLSRPASDLFAFGTGDFTIEFWAYKTANTSGSYDVAFGTGDLGTGNNGYFIELSSTRGFVFASNNTAVLSYAMNPNTSTWKFYAITRSGGTLRLFVDGTSVASTTYTTSITSTGFVRVGGSGNNFFGYIDDLRITKGYARYTANFSVPTAAFPNN